MEWTAITMVKLLVSRQNVMMLEKIMLGEKWKGLGQSVAAEGFDGQQLAFVKLAAMTRSFDPFRLLPVAVAGWINDRAKFSRSEGR